MFWRNSPTGRQSKCAHEFRDSFITYAQLRQAEEMNRVKLFLGETGSGASDSR